MKRFALALVTLVVCAGAQAASDERNESRHLAGRRSVHRHSENH